MKAHISLNKKTKGHLEALKSFGFDAKKVGEEIEVEVSSFFEGEVDLTTPAGKEEFVKGVESKKVLSYSTKVKLRGQENALFGTPLCNQLDKFDSTSLFPKFGAVKLSCLVMKKEKAEKPKQEKLSF